MAIPEKVKKAADRVRAAIYGGEVQESIAKGLEGAGEVADEANGRSKETDVRQSKVETDFKALQQEYTENGNGAQTSAEIALARDGEPVLADRLSRDFGNITAQLAEKANEEITNSTKFKRSKVAINAYWGDYDSATGNAVWVASKEQVEGQIDQFVELIDEIVVVFHLIYNKAEGQFKFIESIENVKHGVEYARSKGIATSAVKLHCDIPESLITSYGKEAFWSVYRSKIDELCSAFSGYDIPYFIPFNEQNHLYRSDSAYLSNVHTVIQQVKSSGYKVTITPNDVWDFLSLSSDTISMLDALSTNLYPNLSSKLDKTTYEDSILGWNQYVPFFEHLKSFGKPIFVSEFGCVDNWQALAVTGGWSFDEAFKGNGMAQEICYRGFFESSIPQYIDSAWIWFYQSIPNHPYVPQTLKSYRGGSL